MKALLPLLFLLSLSSLAFADNLVLVYDKNHTVELLDSVNVTVHLSNNYTEGINVSFGTPDEWLSINQTEVFLNTTNTTRNASVTVTISPETYLGRYTKQIPYTATTGNGYLAFSVEAIEPQTSVAVEVFTTDFEIVVGQQDTGALKLTNDVEYPAFNVTLSDTHDWIIFDENNFTIIQNKTKTILFTVRPQINYTGDTNATHNVTLMVDGSNFAHREVDITVFVPYKFLGNETCDILREQTEMFLAKKEFCDAHPSAADCLTEPVTIEVNVTEYVKLPCVSNMTEDEANLYHTCRVDLNTTRSQLDMCQNSTYLLNFQVQQCNTLVEQSHIKLDRLGGTEIVMLVVGGIFALLGAFWVGMTLWKKLKGD